MSEEEMAFNQKGFEHERILLEQSSSLAMDKRHRWLSNEVHAKQQLMDSTL